MALTYTTNIPLAVRVNDKEKQVAKGDKVPAGVEERIIDALLRSGLLTVTGEDSGDDTPPAPPPDPETLPAERDTREVWDAYARKVGVDPAEHSKKPDLMAAVTAAHEAKQAEGTGGTGS